MSPEQQTINEGNRLIAEVVMGWHTEAGEPLTWYETIDYAKYIRYCQYDNRLKELPFHKDWNWLMKAVEKVESNHNKKLYFEINRTACYFYRGSKIILSTSGDLDKIEAVWSTVVAAAKYISKQKQKS